MGGCCEGREGRCCEWLDEEVVGDVKPGVVVDINNEIDYID